ncbi:hypothetical protein HUG15_15605 [Salicibibacter cibarius]|uniref:YusW-like protein n=1 Tax=Salicibibacter cibarius TaxID=2743000 RepID=A0A7T7CCE0_9BACI|nr:YusW family protein [Salicibibacter cibarius]QQK76848.1 hypothetical protein HUG15_15605 [Salicibibacter cibarius]
MQWKIMTTFGLALLLSACGTADDQNGDDGMNENGDMNGNGNGEATDNADNGDMTEDLSNDMVGDDANRQDEMDGMDDMNGEDGAGDGETALDKGVRELELEIQFTDDTEWEFEYEAENDEVDAEVEKDDDEREGDEAREEIEEILGNVQLDTQQDDEEMAQELISALDLNEDDIYRLELFIELENDEMYNVEQTY